MATFVVVVLPAVALLGVQREDTPFEPIVAAFTAALLSLMLAAVYSAVWSRKSASRDRVFGDLMLWGMIRRARAKKRVANTQILLAGACQEPTAVRIQLLEELATRLEARDAYTHGHSNRVARFAEAIAKQMGLHEPEIAKVRLAAALHDVGKINTPIAILNKPGRLTDVEFAVVKRHPVDSETMVSDLGDDELNSIVRHHHERIDGTGYPDGIAGAQIPIGARIISVADTFDAITSTRAYRAGAKQRKALDIIRAESGRQLDAEAVEAFLAYYKSRDSVAVWSLVATALPRVFVSVKGALSGAALNGAAVAGAAAVIATSVIAPTHDPSLDKAAQGRSVAASPSVALIDRRADDDATSGDDQRRTVTKRRSAARSTPLNPKSHSQEQPVPSAPAGQDPSNQESVMGVAPPANALAPVTADVPLLLSTEPGNVLPSVNAPELPAVGEPSVSVPGLVSINP